jgi:peptide/nickel transport system ATP-binding protein
MAATVQAVAGPTEPVSIVAAGVTRAFGSRRHPHLAVRGIDLTVTNESSIGIVGESGSGKSTLSRMLVGLDRPTDGRILINGYSVGPLARSAHGNRALRQVVQYVPQDTTSSFDPRRSLRASVRRPAQLLLGLDRAAADRKVDELFERLELSAALAARYPSEVSGGQRQRFALARALVVQPRILFCDEVVSALDVSVQGAILNHIKDYCRENSCGLVFVSHGLPATAFVADEMIVMHQGRIVERGPSARVVRSPEHAYTRALIDAYESPLAS